MLDYLRETAMCFCPIAPWWPGPRPKRTAHSRDQVGSFVKKAEEDLFRNGEKVELKVLKGTVKLKIKPKPKRYHSFVVKTLGTFCERCQEMHVVQLIASMDMQVHNLVSTFAPHYCYRTKAKEWVDALQMYIFMCSVRNLEVLHADTIIVTLK